MFASRALMAPSSVGSKVVSSTTTVVSQTQTKMKRVVLGGTGQMGTLLRSYFAQAGDTVVATSRTGQPGEEVPLHNVTWEKTPHPRCEKAWKRTFTHQLQRLGPGEMLCVVNTIGAPTAPKGLTLDDVNTVPAQASMHGLMEAAEELGMQDRIHYTHVTSIAAGEKEDGSPRIPDDPYSQSKTKSEKAVQEIGGDKVTVFRMGYGLDNPVETERLMRIDNHHGWSPDQVATMPFHPIVGDGKQPVQPIAMVDALDGIARAPLYPSIRVIEGVGSEVITQESFYRFFREDLMDAEFRPIRLPPEEMVVLAEHFPHGHFAPYAVKYLANGGYVLDHTALETVVDRPLVKLRDLYGKRDGKTYQMVKPPIGTHVKEAARKIAGNPRSAWEAAKQMPGILSYAYRNSGKGKVT